MATAIVRPQLRVLRLTAGHKYCLLGQLSSEVGWNHYETIKGMQSIISCSTRCLLFSILIKELVLCEFRVTTIEAYLRANNMFVDYDEQEQETVYSSYCDSEKEVITNRLQETEDWLYEDSDDECEEGYTGKLEDLKKLLDPIEMRYNSYKEEKARAEVTKAMQTCIEKYRSGANSMPPSSKKAEVRKPLTNLLKPESSFACSLLRPGMNQIVITLESPEIVASFSAGDESVTAIVSKQSVQKQISAGKAQIDALKSITRLVVMYFLRER